MTINRKSSSLPLGSKSNAASAASRVTTFPRSNPALTLDSIVIPGSIYRYPREDEVPAGFYFSTISSIEVREKGQKTLLDVCYDLEGYDYQNRGQVFHVRQTYPLGSDHAADFFTAIVAAGVKPGPNLKDAIGITERVRLAYTSKNSDFGSFIARTPYSEEDLINPEDELPVDDDYPNNDTN